MRLHEMGMSRHDPNAKSVGAAFRGGNSALVDVTAVPVLAAFTEHRDRRILDPAIFRFTVVCFHADVFRIDAAQMNSRG